MSKAYLLAACMIGLATFLLASQCQAQGNIDKGKTPAQAFAETCAACHRGPRALKRTSAGFLRQHYSVSSAEASAMAAYLAGFPRGRGRQSKRPPATGPETRAEPAKQAKGQPKTATADLTEVSPVPPVADRSVALAPRPKPILEAFEE